jgi:PII-like signaling protein
MPSPLIIEIIDSEKQINNFLPELEKLMDKGSGLVTLEKAKVLRYGTAAAADGG